jgi:hypothetical protein
MSNRQELLIASRTPKISCERIIQLSGSKTDGKILMIKLKQTQNTL